VKRLLITGGSGFLGSHLLHQAQGEVYATYNRRRYETPVAHWVQLDLNQLNSIEPLLKEIKPSVVIHTAAMTDPDLCEREKQLARRVNTRATEALALACQAIGARLIYLSTDMVFDGERGNYSESDEPNPINFYGETKLEGERRVVANCPNSVIARSALIYGNAPSGKPSFSQWILERVRKGVEVPLFYDQYRTPLLVQNLAQALLELAEMDFTGLIHLGGSQRINRYDFGVKLVKAMGLPTSGLKRCSVEDVNLPAPRPRDASFNITRAKRILKTKLLSCDEGIEFLKYNSSV